MPKKVEECVQSVLEDNPSYSESRAWAICQAQMKGEHDNLEVHEMSELGVEDDHLSELEGWEQKEEGVWANSDEGFIVYKGEVLDELMPKGKFEGYTLGTDGDPGDEESFKSFMDALVDAGADVWQVRGGELYTWPEDSDDFPRHDPSIKVIGVEGDELERILDRFNVEFMHLSEGV